MSMMAMTIANGWARATIRRAFARSMTAASAPPPRPSPSSLDVSLSSDLADILRIVGVNPSNLDTSRSQTTRQAVLKYLKQTYQAVPVVADVPAESPLTSYQSEKAGLKEAEWLKKYEAEWTILDVIEAGKRSKLQSQLDNDPTNPDLIGKMDALDKNAVRQAEERETIRSKLSDFAVQYVRDDAAGVSRWEAEFSYLEQLVGNEMQASKAVQIASKYLDSDPLRKISRQTRAALNVRPVIVSLSALLSTIDPEFRQSLSESHLGNISTRKIDMSDPRKVVQVLTDLGYRIDADAQIARQQPVRLPFETDQVDRHEKLINRDGSPMSENDKWAAMLNSPDISSPALEWKKRQIALWMKQYPYNNNGQPAPRITLDPPLNLHLLPEAIQPNIEDLDPDTKPKFSRADVQFFSECPICKKPKTSKAKCFIKPIKNELSSQITHTNIEVLNQYVNDFGMIIGGKRTGTCAKYQRKIACAIKRARQLGLMPYMSKLKFGDSVPDRAFELYNVFRRGGLIPDGRPQRPYGSTWDNQRRPDQRPPTSF